jgi:uncharacterized protein YjcR
MRRLTKEELSKFRLDFEQGMPTAAIAKKYGVEYAILHRWKRKGSWKPWVRPPHRKLAAEAKGLLAGVTLPIRRLARA